jgi:MoxR-like ATPase
LGYPSKVDEVTIMDRQQYVHPIQQIGQVVEVDELLAMQEAVKKVYLDPAIKEYIVSIVEATRKHGDVYLGASPRGSLALFRTSQAWAALDGRDYVLPDDVKGLAVATLAHRVIVSPAARVRSVNPRAVVEEVLDTVPVPMGRVKG